MASLLSFTREGSLALPGLLGGHGGVAAESDSTRYPARSAGFFDDRFQQLRRSVELDLCGIDRSDESTSARLRWPRRSARRRMRGCRGRDIRGPLQRAVPPRRRSAGRALPKLNAESAACSQRQRERGARAHRTSIAVRPRRGGAGILPRRAAHCAGGALPRARPAPDYHCREVARALETRELVEVDRGPESQTTGFAWSISTTQAPLDVLRRNPSSLGRVRFQPTAADQRGASSSRSRTSHVPRARKLRQELDGHLGLDGGGLRVAGALPVLVGGILRRRRPTVK